MHHEQLLSFLSETEQEGIAAIHQKGYQWFKSTFLPYLNLADELLPDCVELLAECWYMAGDIYDFNNCPLQAIVLYKKALEYDETLDGAYRELAYMYLQTGAYQEALTYIEEAIKLDADNSELMDEKAKIIDHINYNHDPYFAEDNLYWQLDEKLASEQFDTVLQEIDVEKCNDNNLLRRYAAALGALGKELEYIRIWQKIKDSKTAYIIDYIDWFYMPESVFESETIWMIFEQANQAVEVAEYLFCDSLLESYADNLTEAQLLALIARWKLCNIRKDKAALEQIAQQYPNWKWSIDLSK